MIKSWASVFLPSGLLLGMEFKETPKYLNEGLVAPPHNAWGKQQTNDNRNNQQ